MIYYIFLTHYLTRGVLSVFHFRLNVCRENNVALSEFHHTNSTSHETEETEQKTVSAFDKMQKVKSFCSFITIN